jgi:hypothetical protein
MQQQVNRVVGRYEIVAPLGEGGMATVYLARQIDLDRLVALKELRALRGSDPSFAQRFLREARMAGSLSHPNIVTVHDYLEAEGTPFIAMEYLERGSLRPYIGHMSLAQVGGVMEGLLAGLEHAAAHGIVHRDLKPENVMVSTDGRIKIADFGIAKARNTFQSGGALTADGTALGTPNYMSPEQALAEDVGPWTDLYALGIMAFEFFTGRTPFADTPEPLVVIMRHVQDPLPSLSAIDPSIDPRIVRWIEWLGAKNPADRPQTAGAAWDAFEEVLIATLGPRWQRGSRLMADAGATVHAPPGPATPLPANTPRGPLTRAALGALAAGGAAGAAAAAAGTTAPAARTASDLTTHAVDADPDLDPTLAPNHLLGLDRTEPAGPGGGGPGGAGLLAGANPERRGRKGLILAVVLMAVVAAVAFGAARRGSSHSAAGAAQSPAAAQPAAPTPAAAPSGSTGTTGLTSTGSGSLKSQAADARNLAKQYNSSAARIEGLKATGTQVGQNALIANLMRKTARAYSQAAKAATAGDTQGYATALAAALAAKNEVQQAVATSGSSSSGGGQPGAAPKPSACGGDSTSDDPSDDACTAGEP